MLARFDPSEIMKNPVLHQAYSLMNTMGPEQFKSLLEKARERGEGGRSQVQPGCLTGFPALMDCRAALPWSSSTRLLTRRPRRLTKRDG